MSSFIYYIEKASHRFYRLTQIFDHKKAALKKEQPILIYMTAKNIQPFILLFPFDIASHAWLLNLFLRFTQQKVFESDDQVFSGYIFVVSGS